MNFRKVQIAALMSSVLVHSTAPAGIWYVDPNAPDSPRDGSGWRTAFNDIQDALDNTSLIPGDEIWVADGVYYPTEPSCVGCPSPSPRHATFRIPRGVSLFGGFHGVLDPNDPNDFGEGYRDARNEDANPTILSGDLDLSLDASDGDALHVVTAVNVDENTKLSGFIIQGGLAVSPDPNDTFGRVGGGVLVVGTRTGSGESIVDNQSSLIMTRCNVKENQAAGAGAGVYVGWTGVPADPNDIRPTRMVNCFINFNEIADPNAVASQHVGAGVCVRGAAFELTNDVIVWNSSSSGGGAFIGDGLDPDEEVILPVGSITNCTFTANKADLGSAIRVFTSGMVPLPVRNTICWADNGYGSSDPNAEVFGLVDVSYSDIQYPAGGYPSISDPNSNINSAPLFCGSPQPLVVIEYALATNSPARHVQRAQESLHEHRAHNIRAPYSEI